MKICQQILSLALVATASINTLCIIDSLSLDRNGQRFICRIGDFHMGLYRPDDRGAAVERRDKEQILALIETIGQSQNLRPSFLSQTISILRNGERQKQRKGLNEAQ